MENYLDRIRSIFSESGKNKVAIIGKGDSLSEIELAKLKDFFIITINDSDKILAGDLCLFYRTDLFQKIKDGGFRSQHYLAPPFFKIPDYKHIEIEHTPANQDSFEYIYDYFRDNDFYLTDFIILSAIKLCIGFQELLVENLEVFLLGFDFHSDSVKADEYQMYDLEYKSVILKTQESFFKYTIENFKTEYPSVLLNHVGEKSYSSITTSGFNQLLIALSSQSDVGNYPTNTLLYQRLLSEVKEVGKVIVVAEFTNNHIGDRKRLLKMIELAKESGADMIKLQKRDVDTFYTETELSKPYKSPYGNTLGDYRRGVELSEELFELVDIECRRLEIPWFVSVLDWNSYLFMQQFDVPLLKLPSTISNHKNYLLRVGDDFKGDLVISTGFTDTSYENFVLENFVSEDRNLFLLQCTSSYPTPPEACQVSVVRHYDELSTSKYPNLFSGYSSHDIGSLGCMLAVAAGAKMLEKHVKLGDLEWIHFDGVAIDLYNNRFKDFIHDVRKSELICGTKTKVIHSQEHHKYTPNIVNN
jgi:sialic acid synthase SpsE